MTSIDFEVNRSQLKQNTQFYKHMYNSINFTEGPFLSKEKTDYRNFPLKQPIKKKLSPMKDRNTRLRKFMDIYTKKHDRYEARKIYN